MNQIFGGNPIGVIVRLVLLSLVVGIILSALDITPANFFDRVQLLAQRIYDLGFGAFEWAGQYLLLGAMVVIPIWLIMRVASAGSSKRGSDADR
ncbi:MAG: DUF6460 domain-containing protein [Pseudomonadota bacterium]